MAGGALILRYAATAQETEVGQYDGFIVGALRIEGVRAWWTSEGSLISQEFIDYVQHLKAPDGLGWRQVSTDEMLHGK